jgi:hypothetical protein
MIITFRLNEKGNGADDYEKTKNIKNNNNNNNNNNVMMIRKMVRETKQQALHYYREGALN